MRAKSKVENIILLNDGSYQGARPETFEIEDSAYTEETSSGSCSSTRGNSDFITAVQISSSIIGGPMLLLPHATYAGGIELSLFMIVFFGIFTAYTGTLLSECFHICLLRSQESNAHRFRMIPYLAISSEAFGRYGELLVAFVIGAQSLLFLAFGLIVAGSNLSLLFDDALSQISGILLCGAFVFPMTLYAGPKEFWWTQVLALLLSFSAGLLIMVQSVRTIGADGHDRVDVHNPDVSYASVSGSIGAFLLAWSGHIIFPTLQMDMHEPKHFNRAVGISYAFNISFFVLIALLGVMAYGEGVPQNMLQALPQGGLRNAALWLMTSHIIFVMVSLFGEGCAV
jgi:amino acid permease